MEAGEARRALELMERIVALHPDFMPAREQLGLSCLRRGDLEGAGAQATAILGRQPQAAEGHRIMALVLWKQRDYEGSLAECAQALAAEPDSAPMLALQALGLWQLKRKKDAQAAFVQAAKVQPQVASGEVFCRLILCDAQDVTTVREFVRKNRWVLAPSPPP
jgi:tetratricopeptide (TPR) repeat protein